MKPVVPRSVHADECYCGTIARVELQNFMCHEDFSIDLIPHVNFIVGRNGSGKSAILVGISVCLGGKMSFTQRGDVARELIRRGQTQAVLRVHFRNGGPEAFMPERFRGGVVVVERVLYATAASVYRLKTASGATVRTGYKHVRQVLEWYGVLVDNPCVLLMQETAKSFLSQATPRTKYDFVRRAMLLERIEAEYGDARAKLDATRGVHARKERQLAGLAAEVARLRREQELVEHLDEKRAEIARLKDQKAWLCVAEQRRAVDAARTAIATARSAAANAKAQARAAAEQRAGATAALPDATARTTRLGEEAARCKEDYDRNVRDLRARHGALAELRAAAGAAEAACARRRKQADALAARLDEARRENAARREQASDALCRVRDARQARVAELEGALRALDGAVQERQARADAARAESARLEGVAAEAAQRVQRAEADAAQVARERDDHLSVFGRGMPALVRAVDERRRRGGFFADAVLGPVGTRLALRDLRWKEAVETVLDRHALGAFVVFCDRDARALRQLAREQRVQATVVLRRHAPDGALYRMPDAPSADVLTVLRVLECADADVLNMLVDLHKIERVALVETREAGHALVAAAHGRVAAAVTRAECTLITRRGGTSASTTMHTVARWFGVDFAARTADCAAQLRAAQVARDEARAARAAAAAACTAAATELARARAEQQAQRRLLSTAHAELRLALAQLEDARPADVSESEASLAALRGALQNDEAALAEKKAAVQRAQEEHAFVEGTVREAEARLQRAQRALAAERARTEQMYMDERRLEREQTRAEQDARARADEQARAEAAEAAAAAKLAACVAEATRLCAVEPQPPWPRSRAELDTVIRTRSEELAARARTLRRPADIAADLAAVAGRHAQAQRALAATAGQVRELTACLGERARRLEQLRARACRRMNRVFNMIMQKRSLQGELAIDHAAQTLDTVVAVREAGASGASGASRAEGASGAEGAAGAGARVVRSARALSGGERSFSTIALLLAVWEVVGSPVCALDEFDVFMDAVNRGIAVKCILDFARFKHDKHRDSRQYIIITPQSDLSVRADDIVCVRQLQPPRRGVAAAPQPAGSNEDDAAQSSSLPQH